MEKAAREVGWVRKRGEEEGRGDVCARVLV